MDMPPTRRPTRAGFTLIELLVVIVIIGILVGLLAPAIFGAIRTAREAAVIAEINSMSNAMAAVQDRFGEYPPSRVILSENGFYDTNTGGGGNGATALNSVSFAGSVQPLPAHDADLLYGQLAQRSLRALRKMFPRVTLSTSGPVFSSAASAAAIYDFNGNYGVTSNGYDVGTSGAGILAEGDEALVFFLGGIPTVTNGVPAGMSGFGKNPQNPFVNDSPSGSQNRERSYYEFRADRLHDDDGDGMPSYLDTLGTGSDARPYAYFVAHPGVGYDPNDVNFLMDDNGLVYQTFSLGFSVSTGSQATTSPGPNPYTTSIPDPVVGTAVRTASFINQNSFQIISAGRDRNFGVGGQYLTTGTDGKLPVSGDSNVTTRQSEADNLTNFATQRLE